MNHSTLHHVHQSVEIVVLGGGGTGKTTLINSLLRQSILPSTATNAITRIHVNRRGCCFSAVAQDASGKSLERTKSLDEASMNRLNELPDVAMIECFGHIPRIESKGNKLIVTDTPSSRETQIQFVRELHNSDRRHVLLYVIDATGCPGDPYLIDCIAKQNVVPNNNGLLFVLTKADVFDPGKGETVAGQLDYVKDHLEMHGISNPRIMPTSALLAKLIRQDKNGKLTSREKKRLILDSSDFIADTSKHFTDYARFLSPVTDDALKARVKMAKDENNETELALFYSGVPSVEMAISEYLTSLQSTLI